MVESESIQLSLPVYGAKTDKNDYMKKHPLMI